MGTERNTTAARKAYHDPGRRRDINSLGEVRSAGIDIDRLCAVRQELLDLLDGFNHFESN